SATYVRIGVSIRLSRRLFGSSENSALGGVSATGVGTPELDVTQNGNPPPLTPCVAIQSGGSAGGVTPSKFWKNAGWQVGVGVGVGVGLGPAMLGSARIMQDR